MLYAVGIYHHLHGDGYVLGQVSSVAKIEKCQNWKVTILISNKKFEIDVFGSEWPQKRHIVMLHTGFQQDIT